MTKEGEILFSTFMSEVMKHLNNGDFELTLMSLECASCVKGIKPHVQEELLSIGVDLGRAVKLLKEI